ncbi:maleylpyruvate isomerase family mycothiol-dependent enzyme [Nonomuraea sp. NPDC049480]|uniref:maleylpyruvate isomerase family mycothiol-dependent enzyme n=1 Tax=Nonomuraea sp. NPDC049480 TaxID=3364353 RepID=UPI0037B79F6F
MNEWDATSYAGKDTILRVVRDEAERLFALAEPEEAWEAPTACPGWTTRDVVAHIVDTTEGYFAAFDAARRGGDFGSAYGLPGMGERVNEQAVALRGIPQKELLDRLKTDFERMHAMLRELGQDEWAGMTVPHFYMGPLPAYFYAAGQLMDYAVHSWDIRQGTGRAHGLSGEAADLLVPFMFVLWQSTIRKEADLTTPFELGIRVGGVNGGDFRVSVGPDGMTYQMGSLDGLPTLIEFDAGSMVLTTFGRSNAGTVRGDLTIADRYLNLFFRI